MNNMNPNADDYVPGVPVNHYGGPPQHHHHNMNPRHNAPRHNPPMNHEHSMPSHHHHYNTRMHNNFSHPPQHHPHLPPQQLPPREAILVLDGVPTRRAKTADDIARWWHCPSIVDTVTAPKEDDETNPAAALQLALESFPPELGRFVIAGFLWNHPHEIHHMAAVLKHKNIIVSAVVFLDTDADALIDPAAFQIHDKPAHPLYCEVATMYFNEKNNFFLSTQDLFDRFKPGGNLLDHVFHLQPTPHKPWGNELRMADYDKVLDIRTEIRKVLENDLSLKFPTHFLTYPLFARYHETISKKCMVSYDFEGDRGHLVRFNNKDYLMFGTGMVFTAVEPYRAPGANSEGISFIFEVHSAKKKETKRKDGGDPSDSSHFFVTDVVYHGGVRYDSAPYDQRQEVIGKIFKNAPGCKWRPVPTVEVSNFNWKSEVDFEIAGYQFFEVGGSNRVFLFKIMETSTANLRLWGGGVQDEATYMWTFQGCMLGQDDTEIEIPNADLICPPEVIDNEKAHFGTVVRARMEKPVKQAKSGKTIWRVVDRNWTTNYPTGIARTSSPWTVEGLFNALSTLSTK